MLLEGLATNIKLCQVGCWRSHQATWRSDGVNLGVSWYCLYHLFHLFPSQTFPLAALLTKGGVKKPSANNANTATCLAGPHPSVGMLFYLFFLHCPLVQPCLVQFPEWDFFPLSQIWGRAGPVPAVPLPPVPWGSLVLLQRGRGRGLSCCGVLLLHAVLLRDKHEI